VLIDLITQDVYFVAPAMTPGETPRQPLASLNTLVHLPYTDYRSW
jgi:hypothetical protein